MAGTGYTGEDGVECAVPAEMAERSSGTPCSSAGMVPAGLGARDTLRLEAALPLHGHELGPGITPLQAGLGWVVGWDKSRVPGTTGPRGGTGRRGPARIWSAWPRAGRQPPREGATVLIEGTEVGTVTSGNFSPVLGHGIALAFVVSDRRRQTRRPPSTSPCGVDRWLGPSSSTPFVRAGQWAGTR